MDFKTPLGRTLLDLYPFDVQVKDKRFKGIQSLTLKDLCEAGTKYRLDNLVPLLHSMDRLIEPILPNGLIPIVELAKLALPVEPPEDFFADANIVVEQGCVHIHGKIQFSYNIENGYFAILISSMLQEVQNYQKLYDKLDEWHFNRRNLAKNQYYEKSLKIV